MLKVVSIAIARETQTWIEALYESGAVTFDAHGAVTVNEKVRNLITLMHEELAAGDPAKKEELEKAFDDAMESTSVLG
ncbi:MAG: hypothetical protein ACOCVR_02940, partial [Myxococcota bacterium]